MSNQRKNLRSRFFVFLMALALAGCATPQEMARSLYGPMPPGELAHTTRQLDAMGIDYEVRNGNEVFLTESERNKFGAALSGDLSNSNFEIRVETDTPR